MRTTYIGIDLEIMMEQINTNTIHASERITTEPTKKSSIAQREVIFRKLTFPRISQYLHRVLGL